MRVLFIGATGLVGSHVAPFLKDRFELTLAALNAGEVAGLPVSPVNICNWEEIAAFIAAGSAGSPFDAVIYCATADYQGVRKAPRSQRHAYYENCIEVNMRGAYHVYEASWRANVARVVHIGSMTSFLGEPKYAVLDSSAVDRPRDLYAASKVFGEQVGRSYVFPGAGHLLRPGGTELPMQVLCLRLGQPYESLAAWQRSPKTCREAVWMEDIARAMERALLTPVQYGVYPIVSQVENPWVDPELYAELGYQPAWRFFPDGSVQREIPLTE